MTTPIIVTGDDLSIPAQLKKNAATFAISGVAVVKARLVSTNHETALTDAVVQVGTTPGAAWATSLVVVLIGHALTKAVPIQGPAVLEIMVDDGGRLTWFIPVQIVKGLVP